MITVSVSRIINAPREIIYNVLRDYREGHKHILPAPYFNNWRIIKGGLGAGTEILFSIEVYGQQTHYHQIVTEPEPGRVIRESDQYTTQYSTFTLDSVGDGHQTRVTIFSAMPTGSGLKGVLQRLFQPRIVRAMFRKELQNLADYVEQPLAPKRLMR